MSDEPILEAKLGNYVLSWPSLGLMVRLSRLHESHDSISAEVELRPLGPGDALHISRLNLFSTQGKAALARHLQAQVNNLEWATLIEKVAQYTIREYRKGDMVEPIGGFTLSKVPKWRLKYIIPEGETAILFGHGESHKTTMALAFAAAIQHGWHGLGLEPVQGNVLYLDYEATMQELNDRLLAMQARMEWPFTPQIAYRHCSRPLTTESEEISQIVLDKRIDVIIVDSAIKAAGGEKEGKENAVPTLNILRSFKTSNLVIAHHAKDPDRPKSPFGSVFWENDPRHVLELRSPTEDTADGSRELVIMKFKSNVMRKMPILGFSVSWDDLLGIEINPKQVSQLQTVQASLPLPRRILDILKSGPMTQKDIAEDLAEKPDILKTTIWRLKLRGQVVYLSELKSWALAAKID